MVIFLAGVHGVGKTFLGEPASKLLGFQYATASSLIRNEFGGKQSWAENKRTKNMDNNQEALISSVSRIIEKNQGPLVLDGHLVLRDEQGSLISISSDIFKRLGVSYVILLEAPSSTVAERLLVREAPQPLEDITELAEAECKNAENICNELNIPLIKLLSPSSEQLLSAFKRATL